MKKVLSIILMLTMILSLFAACGNNKPASNVVDPDLNDNVNIDVDANNSEDNDADINNETKKPAQNNDGKIVNDDGEEFIVDITTKGKTKADAASLDSTTIILDEIAYDFPCAVSDFYDDGYYISKNISFENVFDAKSSTDLVSFYVLNKDDYNFFDFRKIYNDSEYAQPIENCLLSGLDIDATNVSQSDSYDFVLPGGITKDSTAADVLEIFGNPYETTDFEDGYNFDDQLSYVNHNNSHMTYHFTFNEDGTLYAISIELEEV